MRIRKWCLVFLATMLSLSACGPAQPLVTTAVLPSVIEETKVVEVTRIVQKVVVVTVEVPPPAIAAPPIATEVAGAIIPSPPPAVEAPFTAPTAVPPTPVPPVTPQVEVRRSVSMIVPRSMHTATLLTDGRVLLTGGTKSGNEHLVDVEIFDPLSELTFMAAPLNTPRHDHTATLLFDERVLVVGGYSTYHSWLADAEVYDPNQDSWTAIPSPSIHGVGHTATLLNDGRVLVVGGAIGSNLGSALVEIFDPQSYSWYTAAALETDRASHTAQLLEDGRVLVAGGGSSMGALTINDSLVYDPQTDTWTSTGAMVEPRNLAQSVRLADGRVLVAGGISREAPERVLNSAEVYDPYLNTWSATGDLAVARFGHVMVLLRDGRVMAIGGASEPESYWNGSPFVPQIELYDPSSGSWSIAYQLPQAAVFSTGVVLLDGRTWLAGGRTGEYGDTYLADTWIITP